MEYKEFSNPLEQDYDLKASQELDDPNGSNPYAEELVNLVGFLEDEEWLAYGLSLTEYMNPTATTVAKVKKYLEEHNQAPLVVSSPGR